MKGRDLLAVVKETGQEWTKDKASRLGAALAYYSVFSLGPLLIIVIAIAGLVFGEDASRGEVARQLQGFLGASGAKAVEGLLQGAQRAQAGKLATAIGIGTLIFAALGVVIQLKDALNTIWEVAAPKGKGVWFFIRDYIISLAAILGIGFLLMISMVVTMALAAVGKYLTTYLPIPESALQILNFLVSFGVIMLLFAMMFKWLPDTHVEWGDVWIGAAATALLFDVGKLLIGLYIGKQSLDSTYGAAGSLVVILLWIYYSSQIVFLGAEFTQVYARRHGSLRSGAPTPSTPASTPESRARPTRTEPRLGRPAPTT